MPDWLEVSTYQNSKEHFEELISKWPLENLGPHYRNEAQDLNIMGRRLWGELFDVTKGAVLNNDLAYLGRTGSRISCRRQLTRSVNALALESGLFDRYQKEIELIESNINALKFHLQRNLDLPLITAFQFKEVDSSGLKLDLLKFEASEALTYQELLERHRHGVLPIDLSETEYQRRIISVENYEYTVTATIGNKPFFLYALIGPDELLESSVFQKHLGYNYLPPIVFNQLLMPYNCYTQCFRPDLMQVMTESEYLIYLRVGDVLENFLRAKLELPEKGMGWINEVLLLRRVESLFGVNMVFHQARFKWLGRQSIDIFIPSLKLAIEYQGIQHNQVVGFFGGERGLADTKARDKKKRSLLMDNGLSILYVLPNYSMVEVKEILKSFPSSKPQFVQTGNYD